CNDALYMKRYHDPPLREQLRRIFSGHAGRSTADVERVAIKTLDDIGVGAPRWVACGRRMRGMREEASALVLDAVPGQSLERLGLQWSRGDLPPPLQHHAVTRALADSVRHMHADGLFHRDLYLAHVFVEMVAPRPRIRFIDLARLIRRTRNHFRWQVKDLA